MFKEKVLVIGSGIGGLSTGIILAKLGFEVTVIEKNRQPGGMMRSYARRGVQCNVGLHYLGALDQGPDSAPLFRFSGHYRSASAYSDGGRRAGGSISFHRQPSWDR